MTPSRLRRFSIPIRLRIVFGTVIALMLLGSVISFWHFTNVFTEVHQTARAEARLSSVLRLSNMHLLLTNDLRRLAEEEVAQGYIEQSERVRRELETQLDRTSSSLTEIAGDPRYAALSASVASLTESLPRRISTLAELAERGDWETLRFRLHNESDQTDAVVNALMRRLEVDLADARARFRADLDQAQDRATSTLALTTSLSIAIAVALGAVVTRSITKPLERLSAGTRAMAGGDLHHRVPSDGSDELTELARAFNQMGDEIEHLFEDVSRERAAAEGANAALQEQTRELARANADLQQFAYSASHDLQEPLRTISLYSQLLRTKYADDLGGRTPQLVDVLCRSSDQMQQLISDLLAYTQAGHVDRFVAGSTDMNLVAEKVLTMLQGLIVSHQCQVRTEKLPCVRVQETHLQQILQNLFSNSIKYSDSQRRPEIQVWAERKGDFWQVAVRDNGIGIPPEYTEKVFGVFKRLHGNSHSGTGIGLAIVQRIVEGYGGRIWAESEVGRGSTFWFTVPGC